jgi:site-specific DNA-methyltransferase (adenine-specific)
MLEDGRIRKIVDFPDSRQCFPTVDVAGGICYFLWDGENPGDCEVVSHSFRGDETTSVRPLLEPGCDIFIRNNQHISILKKIALAEVGKADVGLPAKLRFDQQVSGQKPFGLRTFFRGHEKQRSDDDVMVLQSGGRAWTSRSEVTEGTAIIDKWKVFTSKSSAEHAGQVDKNGMRKVLSLSGVLPPGSVVTETYVLLGAYDSENQARNCFSYAATKFFRFLVAARASAQDLPRVAYSFVPIQDFSRSWNDADLYKKYGLSEDEISLIETTIRPMDASIA